MTNPNHKLHALGGFKVVELAPGADEDKDAAWLERERKKYPKETFEREFELKPVGRQDEFPVFADYQKQHHENDKLIYQRHLQIIYRGWDFGKVHPCVEFLQPEGQKINGIYEVYGTNIMLTAFAGQILADSGILFPAARFVDWGDATGVNERDDGRASIRVLLDLGIHIKYRRQDVEEGIAAIADNLREHVDLRPIVQINPLKCPHLAEAMRGGYKRDPAGRIIKDGKNDHPVDAFRYAHQGIMFNIQAGRRRLQPGRHKTANRILTDCEMFSRGRQV